MKTILDDSNNSLDTVEEYVSEFEDTAIELI